MHYGTPPSAWDIHFTTVSYLQLAQSLPQQWPLNTLCQPILLGAKLADAFHHISPSEQQNLSSRFVTIGARTKYRLNTLLSHGITSCSLFSCQALSGTLLKEVLMLYLMFSFCFLWSSFCHQTVLSHIDNFPAWSNIEWDRQSIQSMASSLTVSLCLRCLK